MHMTAVIYNKTQFRHETEGEKKTKNPPVNNIFHFLFQQARDSQTGTVTQQQN